jgi:hypothetical protein
VQLKTDNEDNWNQWRKDISESVKRTRYSGNRTEKVLKRGGSIVNYNIPTKCGNVKVTEEPNPLNKEKAQLRIYFQDRLLLKWEEDDKFAKGVKP